MEKFIAQDYYDFLILDTDTNKVSKDILNCRASLFLAQNDGELIHNGKVIAYKKGDIIVSMLKSGDYQWFVLENDPTSIKIAEILHKKAEEDKVTWDNYQKNCDSCNNQQA